MKRVCVIGLGYVGLPTAALLADAGYEVVGVDADASVVERLARGQTRLAEAGLSELVSRAWSGGRLRASGAVERADAYVICVPTPLEVGSDGVPAADLSAVEAAAASVSPLLEPGCLVVLESTSPVGTTSRVIGAWVRARGLEPGRDVHVAYCPERVMPGNTIAELIGNDRLVGGLSPACAEAAASLYRSFATGRVELTDAATAEMAKLMENTFRDVNVALANCFARLGESSGVDAHLAIRLANLHPRVNILRPGPGVGGHCIPIDPWFLARDAGPDAELIRVARRLNDGQPGRLYARLRDAGELRPGDRVAVLGAAYKADIDDARQSPALRFAAAAQADGLEAAIHDPRVRPGVHGGVAVSGDLASVLSGAAAAAVLTDHAEYRGLTPGVLSAMSGRVIADGRACLDVGALVSAGFRVVSVGRPDAAPCLGPAVAEGVASPAVVTGVGARAASVNGRL